jgi:serine/threonine protein kinase
MIEFEDDAGIWEKHIADAIVLPDEKQGHMSIVYCNVEAGFIMKKIPSYKRSTFTLENKIYEILKANKEKDYKSKTEHYPFVDKLFSCTNIFGDYLLGITFEREYQDLFCIIVRNEKGFDVEITRVIIYQLMLAVKYLHSLQIVHHDIKPENILFDPKELKIKLIDFGLSEVVSENDDSTKHRHGSAEYTAPEKLVKNHLVEYKGVKGRFSGKKADIFSIGVVTYCTHYAVQPWEENLPRCDFTNMAI